MKNNNLFSFATSELSQDAFICWCVNWYNDSSKPKLKEMSEHIIHKLIDISEPITSINVFRQYTNTVIKDKKKFKIQIDVLLIINNCYAIIIEDKTHTSEHNNQISNYTIGLQKLIEQDTNKKLKLGDNEFNILPENIKSIYWKTGFIDDTDKVVPSDKIITAITIVQLLLPYENESEILKDYLQKLLYDMQTLKENSTFKNPTNITKYHSAQHHLMRAFFPENRCKQIKGKYRQLYQIYHGSSSGRPWTEMKVYENNFKDSKDIFSIFWRIDTDSKGPYISLRFYDKYKQNNTLERHINKYAELKSVIESIVSEHEKTWNLKWTTVNPGKKEKYMEASLFHIHLENSLTNWDAVGEATVSIIQSVNDSLLNKLKSTEKTLL